MTFSVEDRKKCTIFGKILEFNDKKIIINTEDGTILISGSELEIMKCESNEITITGNLDSFTFGNK